MKTCGVWSWQRGQVVRARDDADRDAARVDQVDREAADATRAAADGRARGVGQAEHVDLVVRGEGGSDEPRPRAPAQDHARRAGVGAAQVQLVGGAQRGREAEGVREGLGADQVGLLELQPGDVAHFDHGVAGPAGVLALAGALLAVQVLWAPTVSLMPTSSDCTDEIVTYDGTLSQGILTKSSKVRTFCYRGWRESMQPDGRQSTAWSGASSGPAPR